MSQSARSAAAPGTPSTTPSTERAHWHTTDLSDQHGERVQVAAPGLRHFGGRLKFCGAVATVRAPDDNSLVRTALEEPGGGRVLVVDGRGSMNCALLGDQLGELAVRNGWAGVLVNGCVRDSAALARLDLGVLALATHPRKSVKRGAGERDVTVEFLGALFAPGNWVYADADGLLVAPSPLHTPHD